MASSAQLYNPSPGIPRINLHVESVSCGPLIGLSLPCINKYPVPSLTVLRYPKSLIVGVGDGVGVRVATGVGVGVTVAGGVKVGEGV